MARKISKRDSEEVSERVESSTQGSRIVRKSQEAAVGGRISVEAATAIRERTTAYAIGGARAANLAEIERFRRVLVALAIRGIRPQLAMVNRKLFNGSVATGVGAQPFLSFNFSSGGQRTVFETVSDRSDFQAFDAATGFGRYFNLRGPKAISDILDARAFERAMEPWFKGQLAENFAVQPWLNFTVSEAMKRSTPEALKRHADTFRRIRSDLTEEFVPLFIEDVRDAVPEMSLYLPVVWSWVVADFLDPGKYAYLKRDYPCPEIDEGPYG